jgi:hypothetical protein
MKPRQFVGYEFGNIEAFHIMCRYIRYKHLTSLSLHYDFFRAVGVGKFRNKVSIVKGNTT